MHMSTWYASSGVCKSGFEQISCKWQPLSQVPLTRALASMDSWKAWRKAVLTQLEGSSDPGLNEQVAWCSYSAVEHRVKLQQSQILPHSDLELNSVRQRRPMSAVSRFESLNQ